VAPALLKSGTWADRAYLAVRWCEGESALTFANRVRRQRRDQAHRALMASCVSLLGLYQALHERRVIHGDVHPRNVLFEDTERLWLLDFGYARLVNGPAWQQAPRGGIEFFFEPEFALSQIEGTRAPQVSYASEQYALAALIYLMLTGQHYLDFSADRSDAYRQIATAEPVPLERRGLSGFDAVDRVLRQALAKEPSDRFASIESFKDAFRRAAEPRHLARPQPRDLESTLAKAAQALLDTSLQELDPDSALFAQGLPAPTCSLNYGSAGIAYALYRLALLREDPRLLSVADLWASRSHADAWAHGDSAFYNEKLGITAHTVGDVSPFHSVSGVLAVQALIAAAMGDLGSLNEALQRYVAFTEKESPHADLTLGRAGVLLGCAVLHDVLPDSAFVDGDCLRNHGEQVCTQLLEIMHSEAALSDRPRVDYLGVAHGWAGLLYAVIRWCDSTGKAVPEEVRLRLEQLSSLGETSGKGVRWRRRIGLEHDPFMAGWCNGTAGFVHLWLLAHRVLREGRYLDLAVRSAWECWETASPITNLCCGQAGQAYALLNVYAALDDKAWLERGREVALNALEGLAADKTSIPHSLYKGSAGLMLLAAESLEPMRACMPFFGSAPSSRLPCRVLPASAKTRTAIRRAHDGTHGQL
jgi:serine/threonine-protein kinase